MRCIEKERVALLSFKQKVVDNYDILSSWDTDVNSDCCNWRGVKCSNINTTTHQHIIGLDLHGSYNYEWYLMGEVSSSLTQLSHLNYLDLSLNWFGRVVLEDIASLIDLDYLNLSYNAFATLIPPDLGNLSKLYVLDLRSNYWLNHNFEWLISSSFSSLKYLDLRLVNFYGAYDWAISISKLPLLQSLFLGYCYITTPILPSSPYSNTNLTRFLVELDLSWIYINFTSSNIYLWMINSTNIVRLNLGYNNLEGLNFNDFENITSLVFLDLTSTQVNFRSFNSFGSLCNLKSLHLSFNNIGGLLFDFLKAFPPCMLHSFESLYLGANNMSGFLPNFIMLPSLKELDLSHNILSETIPQNELLM
ncbi:hypothetical protein Csa_011562 [Cucumis sativus]|nr:hypothetical protein Csa_011562 [Cucumis sativus]